MDSVKSIGFGFENCEYFNIDAKYFGTLELTDFRIDIQRVACNAILKMNCVDTVIMEIFSEGDNKYSSYNNNIFNDLKFEERDKYFNFGLWNKIFKRSTLDKVFKKIPFIDNLCFLDDTYLNKCFMFFARKIVVNEAVIYNYKCKNIKGYRFEDHKEWVNYLLDNCTHFMKDYFNKLFVE